MNIVFVNGLAKEIQRVLYVVKIFYSIKYKMVLRGGHRHRSHSQGIHKKKKHKRKKRVRLSKRTQRTRRSLKGKTQKRRRRTIRASKRLRGG